MDALGRTLLAVSMVLLFVSFFLPGRGILYFLALGFLFYGYFRMFSRNVQKRYRENAKYLTYENRVRNFFRRQKSYHQQRKTHHIFRCPNCKQRIRIPKGKGKVSIRCARCGTEFVRVSR